MKVTFIQHSCYFVELSSCCLLFDYYEGSVPETDKPLYVFASHSHGDHFSPAVFSFPRPLPFVLLTRALPFWCSAKESFSTTREI